MANGNKPGIRSYAAEKPTGLLETCSNSSTTACRHSKLKMEQAIGDPNS